MKKLIVSVALLFALSVSVGTMAQDKKTNQDKSKTECCQESKDKKECCKEGDKKDKACCDKKETDKKDKKKTTKK